MQNLSRQAGLLHIKALIALSTALLVCSPAFCADKPSKESWLLPLETSDSNTKASFEVDTTWHTVHGKLSHVRGRVWLKDVKDELSVQAQIAFPVQYFDTDSKSRDKELRECMAADKFPDATLVIDSAPSLCASSSITSERPCKATLMGSLAMRGVTREVGLPVEISRTSSGDYQINGVLSFDWAAFGITDPSILIARVNKTVKVSYSIDIPSNRT